MPASIDSSIPARAAVSPRIGGVPVVNLVMPGAGS